VPRLAVAIIAGKGRGVFALEAIASGEAVVTDCVIAVPHDHFERVGPPLGSYPFAWRDGNDALALGLTSLANHDGKDPNCFTERDYARQLLRLVAKRDIKAGEEITYDYKVPLWFEPKPPSRLNLEGTK
jgi:SET domain-containing protein